MQSNVVWAYLFFLITIFAHNADETSLWDFYAITSVAYIEVAWCQVCDKTLILRNIGYECLNQFGLRVGRKKGRERGRDACYAGYNQFRNDHPPSPPAHPHLPRLVICQQCSMRPEATQQRVVQQALPPEARSSPWPWGVGRGTPLKTLFSLCRSLWLGELVSMLQGFYRDRDTQLRFPPNYIKKAF